MEGTACGWLKNAYGYFSPNDVRDITTVAITAVLFLVSRFVISGTDLVKSTENYTVLPLFLNRFKIAKVNKTRKLAESIWYLGWHVSSLMLTFRALALEYGTPNDRGWLYYFLRDAKGVWLFTEGPAHVERKLVTWPYISMDPAIRSLMLLALGFWISCCIFIHWETRRSDMRIMQFHHITTVVLITLSYKLRFHRTGLIVMFLHDIPDVLLYMAKCTVYLRNGNQVYNAVVFVLYGISHFVTRILLMGRYICYAILFNMDYASKSDSVMGYIFTLPGGAICTSLIAVLTTMNIYWLNLIISMARRFARDGDINDDREHED